MKKYTRDEAYTLKTGSAHRYYYDNWAKTYEQDFVKENHYVYPREICKLLISKCDQGSKTLADIGCGTGLIGQELKTTDWIIDGFDISIGMLEEARKKKLYRNLICLDLSVEKDYPEKKYSALISTGTFTIGHLGPDVLRKTLSLCANNAFCIFGINLEHFDSSGFKKTFSYLESQGIIDKFEIIAVPIYENSKIENSKLTNANICIFRFIGTN